MNTTKTDNKFFGLADEKGWWDDCKPNGDLAPILVRSKIPEKLALIHSEVSEALECHRNGEQLLWQEKMGKPEGLIAELADVYIRIQDLAGALGYSVNSFLNVVDMKHAYNETRPYKHGGKVC